MMRPTVATMLFALLAASPAAAQLALPGAVAPSPVGAVERPHASARAARPVDLAPGVAAIVGHPLLLNGANGLLQLSGNAKALRIDRLTLPGEVISDPRQQCRIDVVSGAPIETKELGRPDGLIRFEADIPACPFQFDVLDGAALVPAQTSACVFKEADCQASPSGLWGGEGGKLAADAKSIEHARSRAESTMIANFRALSARLKDRAKAEGVAREQAAFSSQREETCRDYAQEPAHGFCATRLTEARAAFLKARADELPQPASKKR